MARQKGAALLVDFIARHPADTVVLTGDLNARPESQPHAILAARLTDTRSAPEVVENRERTTVTRWSELGTPGHHIDHIFVRGARPLRYEVVDRRAQVQGMQRYPSDHLPVRARVCLD
jgi:endonuclease/exonuclease/phosphatase family metal-dependent hydrolase